MKKFILAGVALALMCAVVYAVHPNPTNEAASKGEGSKHARQWKHRRAYVHQLFRVALLAARAREDAELQALVDKAIADRKAMINAESARLDAFEDLVKAVRSGDKEQIVAKREALRQATVKLRDATEKVIKDVIAIRDRLHELYPEYKTEDFGSIQGRGPRRQFRKPAVEMDVAPEIY